MSAQLRAQLIDLITQLDDARQRHAEVDFALKHHRKRLDEIQRQDPSIAALARMLEDIRKLEQQDSIQLLWGETTSEDEANRKRHRIEISLRDYDTRVSTRQHRIRTMLNERAELERLISKLEAQQRELQAVLERLSAGEPDRTEQDRARYTHVTLPWSNQRSDAIRLRAIMAVAVAASILLGYIVASWHIPEPERVEYIEIPERLATLIVKKPPPPPPEPAQKEEEAEKPEQAEAEPEPTPEQKEQTEARKTAEKAGLLAFKKDFAEIMDASADLKMGSQAKLLRAQPSKRRRPAERSIITSPVEFADAGTTTTVARKDVIGDDNKLKQVEFTHIENEQIAAMDAKQLSAGKPVAGKRTDEEIQLVFDRYKDSLYRIYNRELRKNSFLKGKLVLQLTIEPNGKVSKCTIESSDLDAEDLEKKIVARVMRFNFGTKKGAKPLTILYPINFLPAT
ncbi:MAG: AgmX/PglI C-terminal domain-containing protein [Thiotrichales bacterium]|nr:MAG: AgmX/PglI C-terminal domain-containing protein [Thiotrichales bacterium]